MIAQKDIIADLHVHTIFSLHAHSTVKECIDTAESKGLKYIAITDHCFNDGTDLNKKNENARFRYLEKRVDGWNKNVNVIGGAEFNVLHDIDCWDALKILSWKILGLHSWFYDAKNTTLDDLYNFYEQNCSRFEGFAHLERSLQNVDKKKYGNELTKEIKEYFKKLVELAKDNGNFIELNEGSFGPSSMPGMNEKIEYLLKLAKDNGNNLYLGTDAHYCGELGNFNNSIDMLNHIDFPKDKIINCDEDWIKEAIINDR